MPHPETQAMVRPLTEVAYAKINLALHVRARRADGYHALESLFAFAEDGDELQAEPTPDGAVALTLGGPFGSELTTDADNLVLRAAEGLRRATGSGAGARLYLNKRLPVASGIGGGSADAAATLRLLMRLWDVRLPADQLHALALSLGSDVPACIASQTQYVSGRGEMLSGFHLDGLEGAPLLLVNPAVPVSTGSVFGAWDGIDRGALAAADIKALARARNDLEPPAIGVAPVIADVLAMLRKQPGLRLCRMSGSGATCFALFGSERARDMADIAVRTAHPRWWTMATRIRTA
jgi:4-diphosphocytidyl-2-C-methyl-D-erythritol kinase